MDALEARIKLFMLGPENDWIDQGIFWIRLEEDCLQFLDEEFFDVIFEIKLSCEQMARQSESVICIANANGNKYAASFQCIEKAERFWIDMMEFKESLYLALPSLENLERILFVLSNKNKLNLVTQEWLSLLCQSYDENVSKESNRLYFNIFQILINSKNSSIVEGILKNPKFFTVFQALENDSKKSFTLDYFTHFQEKVKFINLLSIQKNNMIEDINIAYRILCLKESLFSQSFPEETSSFLKNMYCKKWDDILLSFTDSNELIIELMRKVISNDPSAFFLIEEIMRHCQMVHIFTKSKIFECFKLVNLFKFMLESANFQKSNPKIMSISIETFKMIAKEDPRIIIDLFSENVEELIKIIENSFGCELEIFTNFCELISELINSDFLVNYCDFFNIFSEKLLPSFLKYLSTKDFDNITEFIIAILRVCTDCIRRVDLQLNNILKAHRFNSIIFDIFNIKDKVLMIEIVQVIKAQIDNRDEYLVMSLLESGILLRLIEVFVHFSVDQNLVFSCIFSLILKVLESENLKLVAFLEDLSKEEKFNILSFFFPKYLCKAESQFSPDSNKEDNKIENCMNNNLDCFDEINHQIVGVKRNNSDYESPVKKPKYVNFQ